MNTTPIGPTKAREAAVSRLQQYGSLTFNCPPTKIRVRARERQIDKPGLRSPERDNLLTVATFVDDAGRSACAGLQGVGYTADDAIAELEQHVQCRSLSPDREVAQAVIDRVRKARLTSS